MAQSTAAPTKATAPKPHRKHAYIKDPALRRLRAAEILKQRIHSVSREQIAENFGLTPTTIDNELKWAKNDGMLEKLEARLLGDIGNKTLKVLEFHLDKNDLDAAKEGLKFIIHANQQKSRREEKQTERDFSLEDYLREKRAGSIPAEFAPVEDPPGAVLQGSLAGAPPSAPESAPGAGLPSPGEDPSLPDDAPSGGA